MKIYNNISTLILQYNRYCNYNEFKRFFLEMIMAKMIHTACGGTMKTHQNGLKCSKCGYKLKHKEINAAYQSGKLDKQEI